MNMQAFLLASTLLGIAAIPARAATVYENDFSTGSTGNFTGGSVITSPSGENYLSDFGQFSAVHSATLTLSGLVPNSAVHLSFTLDAVGSLDGNGEWDTNAPVGPDYFDVDINGTNAFHYNFANFTGGNTQSYPSANAAPGTGSSATDSLGYTTFPAFQAGSVQDRVYNGLVLDSMADASGMVQIVFKDLANQDRGDEFYGIDNVKVTGTFAPTPLPASLPLLVSGLGVLGFAARRKRAAGTRS
jgi:hypothetical protein